MNRQRPLNCLLVTAYWLLFYGADVNVGKCVAVGGVILGVNVGWCVAVGGVMLGVHVGSWVFSGVGVSEGGKVGGTGVSVGGTVKMGEGVAVGWCVALGEGVNVGVALAGGVGGRPSTVKKPDTMNLSPTKICTSYCPASHSQGFGFQSV